MGRFYNPTQACLDSLSVLPIQKKSVSAPISIRCDWPGSRVSLRAAMVMSYLVSSLPIIAVLLSC